MIRILFVCTANVSRSPYAQIRMARIFGDQLHVSSAGVPGLDGHPIDPAMEAELPFEDPRALAHRSRIIRGELLEESDLVLTMELGHQMRIVERWRDTMAKVHGLRQFVDALAPDGGSPDQRISATAQLVRPNSMTWDIADPHGRGRRAARACADELDDLVLRLGRGLGYEPVSEH